MDHLLRENHMLKVRNKILEDLVEYLAKETAWDWDNAKLCSFVDDMEWLPLEKRQSLIGHIQSWINPDTEKVMDGGFWMDSNEYPTDLDDCSWFDSFTTDEKKKFWDELNTQRSIAAVISPNEHGGPVWEYSP